MAAFSFVLFAAATARLLQNPVASSGGLDMDPNDPDRMVDSFGRSTLEPPCSKIDCGETACPDPFVLKTDSTCCGICYAPDHVVAIDRHTALAGGSPYAADVSVNAPGTCAGVKCFTPVCKPGQAVGHVPGACCDSCK